MKIRLKPAINTPLIKVKDMPEGRIGKVNNNLHIIRTVSNGNKYIKVWLASGGIEVVLTPDNQAYDDWDVELLPTGMILEMEF